MASKQATPPSTGAEKLSSGSSSQPPGRGQHFWLLFALAALPLGLLIWHFFWISDDAYISFRYARNLARGDGLVFNSGEIPPVEGYTNFLWVLIVALGEKFQLAPELVSRSVSITCALLLLAGLTQRCCSLRQAHGPVGKPTAWTALPAVLFLACLPPFAVWATGGLATMPFACALFFTYSWLWLGPRPRPVLAAFTAVLAGLLRADGFGFMFLILVGGGAGAWLQKRNDQQSSARLAAAAFTAAVFAVCIGLHFAWRHQYYGDWLPNTARVKVGFSAMTLQRGANYLTLNLISFLSVPLALLLGIWAARRDWRAAVGPLFFVLGVYGYAVQVGGDFMTMGRLLVPSLPFVALLFDRYFLPKLEAEPNSTAVVPSPTWGGARIAIMAVVSATLIVLSLLPGFHIQPLPIKLRSKLAFRWSNPVFESETEAWERMRKQAELWRKLGLALAEHTQPGESIIHGTIGAVGYHTELEILDPFGLVNREILEVEVERKRRSPGHDVRVPMQTFMRKRPDYLSAALVPPGAPSPPLMKRVAIQGRRAHVNMLPITTVESIRPGAQLQLVRFIPGRDGEPKEGAAEPVK